MNSKVHILINMKEYVLLKLIQEKKLMTFIYYSIRSLGENPDSS